MTRNKKFQTAFTLVELLVVIGIIALLISMLMPTLAKARQTANSAKCKSNMRQIGIELVRYSNDNRGWLFPVGDPANPNQPAGPSNPRKTYGAGDPPSQRWMAYVWKLPLYPGPYADPNDATPWTPPVMLCPSDFQPAYQHSYVLNEHLSARPIPIRANSTDFGGKTSQDVVLLGEKVTDQNDYYMDPGDFPRVVEKYRHGINLGSNYLYLDGHVDTVPPSLAGNILLDPWDVLAGATPTTAPAN